MTSSKNFRNGSYDRYRRWQDRIGYLWYQCSNYQPTTYKVIALQNTTTQRNGQMQQRLQHAERVNTSIFFLPLFSIRHFLFLGDCGTYVLHVLSGTTHTVNKTSTTGGTTTVPVVLVVRQLPVPQYYRNGSKDSQSKEQPHNNLVLRDRYYRFAKLPSFMFAAQPADTVINEITRVNNILSNFFITYFFMILAQKFKNILYQEFLFNFVKREKGWKQFVQYC